MTTLDWIVLISGATAIAAVAWYFFAEHGSAGDVANSVIITVKSGYSPSVIRVRAGQSVHLTFDRQETSSCSEEIVFPDFGIRTFLPANETTEVVLTPPHAGTYEFTCGMSMLHGRLVAE